MSSTAASSARPRRRAAPACPGVVRVRRPLDVAVATIASTSFETACLLVPRTPGRSRSGRRAVAQGQQHEAERRADVGPPAPAQLARAARRRAAGRPSANSRASGTGGSLTRAHGGVNGSPSASCPWPPTGRQQTARSGLVAGGGEGERTPGGTTIASPRPRHRTAPRRGAPRRGRRGRRTPPHASARCGDARRPGRDLDEPHAGVGRPAARCRERGELRAPRARGSGRLGRTTAMVASIRQPG